jgi:ketosteroid isomerase-like protein
MSQENVEILRRAFDALNRSGVDGILPFLDPQIEWVSIPDFLPDARDYYGHDGVASWFQRIAEVSGETTWELAEITHPGEPMVVASRISGRGKGSGTPMQITVFHVITLANGKALRFESYLTRSEALEAAGLSEVEAAGDS